MRSVSDSRPHYSNWLVPMNEAKFYVWVWFFPGTERPAFVGCGKSVGDRMPWDVEFDDRGGPTRLSQWLGDLDGPPPRDPNISATPMEFKAARSYAARLREGIPAPLIPNRSYEGTQSGGGKARPVIGPDGTEYPSVRAAADAVGVKPPSVTNWCKRPEEHGWRYADADYQAKRTAVTNCCSLCHSHNSRTKRISNLIAGPAWAPGAICKKCRNHIRRLEKDGQFSSEALRARADRLFDEAPGRRKLKIWKDQRTGRPTWLRLVAKLIYESTHETLHRNI
jgi:hypothetical protein